MHTERGVNGQGYPNPSTLRSLAPQVILTSKTIIWNGPMGVFEMASFEKGTKSMMDVMVQVSLLLAYIHL